MSSSLRRGVVWISHQTVMVQANHKPLSNVASPMMQRGYGYRLPTRSAFQPLATNKENNSSFATATATEMVDGVDWFHNQNIHPQSICFGGGHSEPLASLSAVTEAMRSIREQRHGTPLVLMTNGLYQSNDDNVRQDVSHAIIDMHEEWRDAPGSDGDSKLSVFINVGGSSPSEYDDVMRLKSNSNNSDNGVEEGKGFYEVCGFITNLVESGVRVYGTGSYHPTIANIKQVEAVCLGMGCSDFFARSYHPRTLYDVLELQDGTSDLQLIKEAYRTKAKELHPDVMKKRSDVDEKISMEEVTEAYNVLSDENLRSLYESDVADLILNDHEEDYFTSIVNKSI